MTYDIGTELLLKGLDKDHADTARTLLNNLGFIPGKASYENGIVSKVKTGTPVTRNAKMGQDGKGNWGATIVSRDESDKSVCYIKYSDYSRPEAKGALCADIDGKLTTDKGVYFFTCHTLKAATGQQTTFNPDKEIWETTIDSYYTSVMFFDKEVVDFLKAENCTILGDECYSDYITVKNKLAELGILPDGTAVIGHAYKDVIQIANEIALNGSTMIPAAIEQSQAIMDVQQQFKLENK